MSGAPPPPPRRSLDAAKVLPTRARSVGNHWRSFLSSRALARFPLHESHHRTYAQLDIDAELASLQRSLEGLAAGQPANTYDSILTPQSEPPYNTAANQKLPPQAVYDNSAGHGDFVYDNDGKENPYIEPTPAQNAYGRAPGASYESLSYASDASGPVYERAGAGVYQEPSVAYGAPYESEYANADQNVYGAVDGGDAIYDNDGAGIDETLPRGRRPIDGPLCGGCQKPFLFGEKLTCNGVAYHPPCFVCAHCKQPLGTAKIYPKDGKMYCEKDYIDLFCDKCATCHKSMPGERINALGQLFHPACFVCQKCRKPLTAFVELNGKAYCKEDFAALSGKACGKCAKPLGDESYLSALNKTYHPDCFTCTDCHQPFKDGRFFDYQGRPYCETHYGALSGKTCVACNKLLQGTYVNFQSKKYHPEHFTCTLCKKTLATSGFMEKTGNPYCKPCHVKLFG
eukprot:m.57207 g.57207  ORF g.57207 m.57207 type:complete len:456 (+) comp6822_c0_seq1:1702-3069(+)